MKIVYKGEYFYVYSGYQYTNDLQVEERYHLNWVPGDLQTRIQIFPVSSIIGIDLYPDLFEIHLHIQGHKVPKEYKTSSIEDFYRFVGVLQSGLHFELI